MSYYQELIEAAHDMTSIPQILAALEDGALLAEKENEWAQMQPDEIINEIKYELAIKCEHCGQNMISDDPDIAEEMLCDKCADRINNEGIIGYRKGE